MMREPEPNQPVRSAASKSQRDGNGASASARLPSADLVGSKPPTCIGSEPAKSEPAQDVGLAASTPPTNSSPEEPLVRREPGEPDFEPDPADPAEACFHVTVPRREMWRTPNHYEPAEDAYRRGFHQGATAALDAAACGVPPRLLQEWRRALGKWRHNRTTLRTLSPPRIADPKGPDRAFIDTLPIGSLGRMAH
jgi:hypothetical protein